MKLSNHPEIPVKDVAEALDIHPFMLSRWKKEYREGKIVIDKRKKKPIIDESSLSEKKHIRQLERENQKLRIENEMKIARIKKRIVLVKFGIFILNLHLYCCMDLPHLLEKKYNKEADDCS